MLGYIQPIPRGRSWFTGLAIGTEKREGGREKIEADRKDWQ